MSKRRAEGELTKDNAHFEDYSDDDRFAPVDPVKRASQDVLAGRAIAKPRSLRRSTAGVGATAQPANPFAGALGFNSSAAPSQEPQAAKNPFSFLGASGSNPGTSLGSFSAHQQAKPAVSTLSTSANPPAVDTQHSEKIKIAALNTKFAQTIASYAKSSISGDWTKACQSYINYYQRIGNENNNSSIDESANASKAFSSFGESKSATRDISMEESASASDDEQGPSETPATATAAAAAPAPSGFKFSGSTNDVGFSFGGQTIKNEAVESKPSGVTGFVFKPDANKKAQDLPFAKHLETQSEKPADTKPALNFGAPKPDAVSAPPKPSPSETKPVFSFGGAAEEKQAVDSKVNEAAPASKFNFGSSSDTPKFSFGQASADSKPAFTFNTATESKPGFSFGQQSTEKPKFSFGAAATAGTESPGGTELSEKPSFSFGKATTEDKPKFTFGQAQSDDSKPKFTFGQPSGETGDAPKFSFGMGTSWTPGNQIKFDQPSNGVKNNGTENSAAQEAGDEGAGSDGEANPENSVDLSGKGPGEENEDSVYEKRSKVYEVADGQVKSVGLGNLRVLVNNETKKSRLLVRADGSGRVLVNIGLRKALTYTHQGNGSVKVLDFTADQKPVTYLLRVKTAADGDELASKLQEVKN